MQFICLSEVWGPTQIMFRYYSNFKLLQYPVEEGEKKKAKKPSASLESINWYLLAALSQFQPYSLCLVQPQARNQSTYFPLDLWGLQAVFEAPPQVSEVATGVLPQHPLPLLVSVAAEVGPRGKCYTGNICLLVL